MKRTFPMIGFIAHWPSLQIIKIRIDKCVGSNTHSGYPFKVSPIDPKQTIDVLDVAGNFYIADPSLLPVYPTRKQAEMAQLQKLLDEYSEQKRELRKQEKRVKWANNRIAEWKAFKRLHSHFFTEDEE